MSRAGGDVSVLLDLANEARRLNPFAGGEGERALMLGEVLTFARLVPERRPSGKASSP